MKKISFTIISAVLILLSSCGGEQTKLDKLLGLKKKLRSELADVQNKINEFDVQDLNSSIPLVRLEKVQEKNFIHKIEVQGSVETDQDILLNSEMGGLITQVHVKEGQSVTAGQVLVSLDASIISSNIQELQTQLEYAEYMLQKQDELKKRGVGSDFDFKTAKNQVDGLKSKMKSLGTQRGKSVIKAPFSGVIDKIYAKNGQVAGPQSPLMRLVNNKEINITADISEKHFENVKMGTAVKVTFPNFKDTSINLKVTYIGNYIDPTNRTFRVMANVKNNKTFLPNMLAQLEITDVNTPNALVIASRSVLKSQLNEDFIFIAKKEKSGKYKVKKIRVNLLEKYNGQAHIQAIDYDLKQGDFVIVDGARGITENDIVRTK